MSTATPVAEVVEEVKEETKKKGRKKGQKLFNHDQIHTSKEAAEDNTPYYAQEVTKTETKDGKEIEITEYEGEEEADGFRLYLVKINEELLTGVPHSAYVWGRNGDSALSTFCGQFSQAELVDAKPRGRAKKVDGIYVMFFLSLIEQGKTQELVSTLKEQELLHYIEEPRINAAIKAKGLDPATIAA